MAAVEEAATLESIVRAITDNHFEWLMANTRAERRLEKMEEALNRLQTQGHHAGSTGTKQNRAKPRPQATLGTDADTESSEEDDVTATEDELERSAPVTSVRRRNNPTKRQREAKKRRQQVKTEDTWRRENDCHVGFSTGSADRRERQREKKLMRFNGDEEWCAYHAHFKAVSEYNRWDDEDQLAQLATSLSGTALEIYADMPTRTQRHLPDLLVALRRRFAPDGREAKYRAELLSCSRVDEAPDIYGQRLERLARRAYPDMTANQRDEIVLDHFIEGQSSDKLREVMVVAYPKTLNEAITAVYKHEANARATRYEQRTSSIRTIADDSDEEDIQTVLKELKKLRSQVHGHVEAEDEWQTVTSKRQRRARGGRSRSPRATPRDEQRGRTPLEYITCHLCGEKGHYQYTCPDSRPVDDGRRPRTSEQSTQGN